MRIPRLSPRARRRDRRARVLNLGLQGGGAHGAFTWGVLDGLLEDDSLRLEAVSGASAGAVNAVALAAGLLDGGAAGARRKLAELWQEIAAAALPLPFSGPPADLFVGIATRLLSPYQLGFFGVDPLRDLLARTIDFDAVRRQSQMRLYISATDVATGGARLFTTAEITLDALLASACLPHLRQAVRIDGRDYWDGGYSANPPLLPLLFEGAGDTLLVLIDLTVEAELPVKAAEIEGRLGRLTFGAPLRREIELIERWRSLDREGVTVGGRRRRRLRRHRFHLIEAGDVTGPLHPATKLHPERGMLEMLRDAGRGAVQSWRADHGDALGSRATVDLAAKFL